MTLHEGDKDAEQEEWPIDEDTAALGQRRRAAARPPLQTARCAVRRPERFARRAADGRKP